MASARDRDDARPTVIPWTVELAFRAARIDASRPVKEKREAIQRAVREKRLPPEAVTVLRGAGWLDAGRRSRRR